MSKELRGLRKIRHQLQRYNSIERDVSNCGNTIIKFILLGGVLVLFMFLILLAIVMF